MRAGRKVADPVLKELMGTKRKDRHGSTVEIATPPASVPVAPAYLTKEARVVWREEFDRIVACGGVEADSSAFARYCALESLFRADIIAGNAPIIAMTVELRRLGESLGIVGRRSRLLKAAEPATAATSKFVPLSLAKKGE